MNPAGCSTIIALVAVLSMQGCTQRQSTPALPPTLAKGTASGEPPTFEPALPLALEPGSFVAGQRDHYNRIYSQPQSERPPANEFLLHCLDVIDALRQHQTKTRASSDASDDAPTVAPLAAPTALDIAMGDGRNTIALAQRGYQTSSYDMSDVGVSRARKRAVELGLTLDAQVGDSLEPYLQFDRWDVVALMYFSIDDNKLQRLKQSIKPGGFLIIEFSTIFPDEPRRDGDRTLNWTLHRYIDWEIIHYEYAIGPVQWKGKQIVKNEPAPRIRVLARKPAAR
jgi:SAM-dependent methyltransferase